MQKKRLAILAVTLSMASAHALTPEQIALARQYGASEAQIQAASASAAQSATSPSEAAPALAPTIQPRTTAATASKAGEPFGYSLFAGMPTSNTPLSDLPVPDDYLIGPGDELKIQLYGKENALHTLRVGRQGNIDFPGLGPIYVAGNSYQQVAVDLISRIKSQMLGVDVFVSMGALRMMQITVTGEAFKPGAYNVNALTTITQALQAAGGLNTGGSLRKIQVKRNGRVVQEMDLYQLLLRGDNKADIRLRAGDVVFIPAKGPSVSIDGLVRRPAIYELRGRTSLNEMIALGGGLKPEAQNEVRITRQSETGPQLFNINTGSRQAASFTIRDGDAVSALRVSDTFNNAVVLKGAVLHAGPASFKPGMRINQLISSPEKDLLTSIDLEYGVVVREVDASRRIQVLQFKPGEAMRNPGSRHNLTLQKRDQIILFASDTHDNFAKNLAGSGASQDSSITLGQLAQKTQIEAALDNSRESLLADVISQLKLQAGPEQAVQIVEIRGEVRFPGIYPLPRNGVFSDLITAAGGRTEAADRIELSRYLANGRELKLTHNSFDIPLNDTEAERLLTQPLQSKDRLNVLAQPEWREEITVKLEGEVRYPGSYVVKRGEMLSQLIRRAGGLTSFSNPQGAIFTRESLREQEQENLRRLNEELRAEMSYAQLRSQGNPLAQKTDPSSGIKLAEQLENTKALGRLVINGPAVLAGDKSFDILLENQDRLFIPQQRNSVSIIGEVQFPSNHTYQRDLDMQDYLERAGGAKKRADTSRVYIVKADGSVRMPSGNWIYTSTPRVEAGDTIVVPADIESRDSLATWTAVTQIMYQLGVAWAAIKP
ncbi:SLBB domain-containing protein [Craterilacuibacter sinensis]|uniref:Sugar transporter n=1 Tax=Craterilacuibacter sinensis TaxID=2686017 RepID=A0A845BTZ7_9NEIS|nr:SLBB domain-containing protein [Craterilacuibacter sinensis]MXR37636.1 sugar transporter [Craterilacuibacter sinensis]